VESSKIMTNEDGVNLIVTKSVLSKNYLLCQTKQVKKEIEGTSLSQVSDM